MEEGEHYEDEEDYEEELFDVEEISNIVKYSIEQNLGIKYSTIHLALYVCPGTSDFSNDQMSSWVNSIVESSVCSLSKLQKTYKYVVSCILLEKTGSGLTVASSCYWDGEMDGSCTVRWENRTMCCIVNVFGLAM